jgi:hypothetical protein
VRLLDSVDYRSMRDTDSAKRPRARTAWKNEKRKRESATEVRRHPCVAAMMRPGLFSL